MKKLVKFITSLAVLIAVLACSTVFVAAAEPRIAFCASVKLVSYGSGSILPGSNLGHSYIAVENISSEPIMVGHMQVAAGEMITIGTFGNRDAHIGIWYNIEAYNQSQITNTQYALGTVLTKSDLATMNRVINDTDNDGWTSSFNSAQFAIAVWNSIATDAYKISGAGTPAVLVNRIKAKQTYLTNPTIRTCSINRIAYQLPNGIVYNTQGANPS